MISFKGRHHQQDMILQCRVVKKLIHHLLLTDGEKATLSEIAHRLGRQALKDVAHAARPDTILGWYRKLVARKFDGSKSRRYPGRPGVDGKIEELVVRMARENSGWVMTGSSVPWRTSAIHYPIKRQGISCSTTVSQQHRNGSVLLPGQTSFVLTCLCLRVPTFSRWKY